MLRSRKNFARRSVVYASTLSALIGLSGCAGSPALQATGTRPSADYFMEQGDASPTGFETASVGVSTAAPVSSQPNPATPPRQTIRELGSGQFYAPADDAARNWPEPEGDVVLNFADSDIREVSRAVFEDILSLNYVIDPQVTGKVSLSTSRAIRKDKVLPLVESVFHLSGAAIVYKDGIYHVVRESEALKFGAPLSFGISKDTPPGYGVRVMPMRFTKAGEIAKLVGPLAPKDAIVSIDDSRNLLILAGDSGTLNRLASTVASFDVDWMSGMSFSLVPVNSPDPSALSRSLEDVFGMGGAEADKSVKFLPLDRLGSVLVASRQPSYLARAEEWVERLDRGQTTAGRQLWVYDVQFGRAPELAGLLSSVFTGGDNGPNYSSARSLVAPGESVATLQTGASVEDFIDDPSTDFSPIANGPEPSQANYSRTTRGASDGVRIFPYETSNSLAIFATEAEYRAIEAALIRLDVRPMQVMLEVTIADVTLNDDLRLGVQWFLESGEFKAGLTQSTSSLASIGATLPGFAVTFKGSDATAAISALESVTDVQILSRPRLLVSNNEQAGLQVGDQVPIVTRTATSTVDPAAPIVSNVELRDTGVILNVTPRINANGLVSLDIEQEVSDVAPTTTSGIDSPTIRQRKLNTNVTVDSGATVALGGLIRDDATVSKSGIPGLSRIPLVGGLFGTTNTVHRRGELIVLITPRVVQAPEDLDAVTRELMDQISMLGS